MNKEIKLLIEMVLASKENYLPSDLGLMLNLKFTEGVYPYLRKLQEKDFVEKNLRGKYSLNQENKKVQDIIFITNIVGKKAEILFTRHTKVVLEKFSTTPIIFINQLPQTSLMLIKDIASNTKILHKLDKRYFIACWEETTKRILDFFDITLKFDEEEFKHQVTKFYSSIPNTEIPADDESQKKLKTVNMQAYLTNQEYILNRIKEVDFPVLSIGKVLTEKKKKEYSENPFLITSKINNWKMQYIYNTDRIEGNTLTMQEVRTILTMGAVSADKDKKEVLETINSKIALDNIFDTSNEVNEDFIKKLHIATQLNIDKDAGKYKIKENCINDDQGNFIDSTTPAEFVPQRMKEMIKWYHENKNKLDPLVLASVLHNQFVYIHPFNDGNGRVARLIFNFILIKKGYFPLIFYNDEKQRYYASLRSAKGGDIKIFLFYCLELYRTQLDEF